MLLELSSLPQIPGADSVVEPSGPQFGPIVGYVDTAGSICVALELPGRTQDTKHEVRNRRESSNNNHFILQIQRVLKNAVSEFILKVCHISENTSP